jgi:UDP-glucose:(heptosyl)LPS alpha-1,3-glucosyltransferase
MRLLISLYKYFPYGGLQKDTLRFAREAAQRGHQVDLLTTDWQGERPTDDNLAIHFTPSIRAWTNTARMEEFARNVEKFRRQRTYDVTLAMNRIPNADFYFAADSCLKHYLRQKHWPLTLALLPRYRAILRQEKAVFSPLASTRIFTISDAQVHEFQEEYGTQPERFCPLPPGMDEACLPPPTEHATKLRADTRTKLGVKDDEFLLLLVGTSFLRKGADRALTTLAALPAELRKRTHFAMVGNNPPEKLYSFVKDLPVLSNFVHPIPPQEHVTEYLLAADLMVHPAREEGTGTVLVEGLACGLPVVCTAVCGFSPYVAAAGCPVIPEPFSQDSLTSAVTEALAHLPELRKRTATYASTQDFCGRSRSAIDAMERFFRQ